MDENNKMYLFWTSADDRVDKLDHFVPNDLNPPPLKQTNKQNMSNAKFMYLSQIHYWRVYLWILVKKTYSCSFMSARNLLL